MANILDGAEIKIDDSFYSWISRNTKGVNKENKQQSLNIYKNVQKVGVYFSANWIPQSKDYIPVFEKIRGEMKSLKESEFEMILISCDKNESDMLEFLNSTDVHYPAIPPTNQVRDILKQKFDVTSIPASVIINAKDFTVIDNLTKTKLNNLYVEQDVKGVCDSWLEGKAADIKGSPTPEGSVNETTADNANEAQRKAKKLEKDRTKKDISERKQQDKLEKEKQKQDGKELKKQAKEELTKEKKRQEEEKKRLKLERKKMRQNNALDSISICSTCDLDGPAYNSIQDFTPKHEEIPMISPTCNSVREVDTVVSDTSSNCEGKKKFGPKLNIGKKNSIQVDSIKLEHENNDLVSQNYGLKLQNDRFQEDITLLKSQISEKEKENEEANNTNSELEQKNVALTSQIKDHEEDLKTLREELYEVKEEALVLKNEIKEQATNMHQLEEEKSELELKYMKLCKSLDINGWMCKRGTKSMTKNLWRNRYFQLGKDDVITFYKSSNSKSVRGSIQLSDIEKVEEIADKSDFLFNIYTKERSFEMKASDESTRKNWIEAINFLIENSRREAASTSSSPDNNNNQVELINNLNDNADDNNVNTEAIEVSPAK